MSAIISKCDSYFWWRMYLTKAWYCWQLQIGYMIHLVIFGEIGETINISYNGCCAKMLGFFINFFLLTCGFKSLWFSFGLLNICLCFNQVLSVHWSDEHKVIFPDVIKFFLLTYWPSQACRAIYLYINRTKALAYISSRGIFIMLS